MLKESLAGAVKNRINKNCHHPNSGGKTPTVRSDSDRNHYENKCAALDRQIDNFVDELYELEML